jgi:hypothetical protein
VPTILESEAPAGGALTGLATVAWSPTPRSCVWRKARKAASTTEQAASPLARRPYDLRHAGISLWLNAGVAATEVARRAAHGVAVMLQVYANCVDGEEQVYNDRITQALASVGISSSNGDGREKLHGVFGTPEAELAGVLRADHSEQGGSK